MKQKLPSPALRPTHLRTGQNVVLGTEQGSSVPPLQLAVPLIAGSSRLPQEPEILSGPQNPVPTVRQTMGPGCAPLPATCGHTFPGAAEYTAVLPRPSESPALGPLLALTTGLPVDGCSIRGGRACRS